MKGPLDGDHLKELNDAFGKAGDRLGQLGFSLAEKAQRFEGEHRRTELPWTGTSERRALCEPPYHLNRPEISQLLGGS